MKKSLWALVYLSGLIAIISGCSTGGGGTSASGGGVKIENWPSGQTGRVEFYIGGSTSTPFTQGNVDANGNLNYTLPTPSASLLSPLNLSVPSDCNGSVNANPSNANTSGVLLQFAFTGTGSTPSGSILIANRAISSSNLQQGDKVAFLLYADRDVSITGSYNCPASESTPASTTSFNMALKTGWNYLMFTVQAVSGSSPTQLQFTSSTSLPPDLKWYYTTASISLSLQSWLR